MSIHTEFRNKKKKKIRKIKGRSVWFQWYSLVEGLVFSEWNELVPVFKCIFQKSS